MSKKEDLSFFLNKNGEIEYFKLCVGCKHDCKQSFRVKEVRCPKYKSREK